MDSLKHDYLEHSQSSLQNTLKTNKDFHKLKDVELATSVTLATMLLHCLGASQNSVYLLFKKNQTG